MTQGQSHCASNIISNSHPFHYNWINPPIPELQQFQYFTLKIQGQGHGWGQNLKSQCESNFLSTHIPFFTCQSATPFRRNSIFKIWPWKFKVGQGHGGGQSWRSQSGCNILSTHIPFVPCQLAHPFLRYSIFKIWPWKSKVKVMVKVKVESHKVGVASYRLTSLSFHVNRPSHSWDTAFSKFDLENPRSRPWWRSKLKVTRWV